jgi:hypothetical protein
MRQRPNVTALILSHAAASGALRNTPALSDASTVCLVAIFSPTPTSARWRS